jgi:3-hydroxyacyl-CoA dehydrogenase
MSEPVTLLRDDEIGVISINNPPVNALSQPVRAGLVAALAEGNSDSKLSALVIHCEGRTFIAGADIREFGKPLQPPGLTDVIDQIERASKPVIAAIHGTALGGGFEVALGCHYRVGIPSAKVGLPEVKLGLLPGAGGTQRLPRLIGPEQALKFIVEGNPIPAGKAAEIGIIDEIIQGDLRAGAVAFARKVVAEKRPLRNVSALTVRLENPNLFSEFEKGIAKKQRGFLAPFHCIKAVQAACGLPFAEGMKLERELFLELMASPQSKAQRHVFFAEREVAKIPGLPDDQSTREVKSVGIVGAGTMGGGITMSFLNAGIPVTLVEMNQENLGQGLQTIRRNYSNSVTKGSLSQAEMDKRLALLKPTLSYNDLSNADLIIEAVFEEMGLKKEVFAKLDVICKPGAILASNTSYLNIEEIAQSTKRPEDVMGMHFFSPANVMKLLENVRGRKTTPEVYATAMKVGKAIGKVPVLVGVCDGFVGNRMLAERIREHSFMLEEGALPQQVDKVLYDFGFPMGPFAMGDLAGLDVGWRNRKSRMDKLTPRERGDTLLEQICELGRYGQKTGAGFYKYDDKRNPSPDPLIENLILEQSKARGITRRTVSEQEILERSIYSMINEGAKILEEGIVGRPADIDIVWIYGYGFPVYRGGPMFYADQIGLKTVYDAVLKYQRTVGEEYWQPAALLERLAKEGKGFYSR